MAIPPPSSAAHFDPCCGSATPVSLPQPQRPTSRVRHSAWGYPGWRRGAGGSAPRGCFGRGPVALIPSRVGREATTFRPRTHLCSPPPRPHCPLWTEPGHLCSPAHLCPPGIPPHQAGGQKLSQVLFAETWAAGAPHPRRPAPLWAALPVPHGQQPGRSSDLRLACRCLTAQL